MFLLTISSKTLGLFSSLLSIYSIPYHSPPPPTHTRTHTSPCPNPPQAAAAPGIAVGASPTWDYRGRAEDLETLMTMWVCAPATRHVAHFCARTIIIALRVCVSECGCIPSHYQC